MSSILDALNKLDEEEAQVQATIDRKLDDDTVVRDLVGRDVARGRNGLHLSPWMLIAGGAAFLVLLVTAAVAVTVLMLRTGDTPALSGKALAMNTIPTASAEKPEAASAVTAPQPSDTMPKAAATTPPTESLAPSPAANTTLEPKPQPAVVTMPTSPAPQPVTAASTPAEESAATPVTVPAVSDPASTPVATPEAPVSAPITATTLAATTPTQPTTVPALTALPQKDTVETTPQPAQAAKTPKPKPAKLQIARNDPPAQPGANSVTTRDSSPAKEGKPKAMSALAEYRETRDRLNRKTSTRPAKKELVLAELPMLRPTDSKRYGLSGMRINMPQPATKSRPQASALINLTPVYVGERIGKSQAKLVGVDMKGIGVEIISTGERFYMRQ